MVSDKALTAYVIHLIHRWESEADELGRKRTAMQLEDEAGVARGLISKIRSGTGVGAKSGTKFAPVFHRAKLLEGADYDALHQTAHKWWREQGRSLTAQADETETTGDVERDAAIQMAKAGNVPHETIVATLARFRDVTGRDRWWWIAEFGRDVELLRKADAEKAQAELTRDRVRRKRIQAPESQRVIQGAPPDKKQEVPVKQAPKRRRRAR